MNSGTGATAAGVDDRMGYQTPAAPLVSFTGSAAGCRAVCRAVLRSGSPSGLINYVRHEYAALNRVTEPMPGALTGHFAAQHSAADSFALGG